MSTTEQTEIQVETSLPNQDVENTSNRMVGQVKWFNNKAGYGFITLSDGEKTGTDIFAHYSTINVADSQYRYLIQGEYVEFELSTSTNDTHEFQATNISGIKGGKLMCETRQVNRPPVRKEFYDDRRPYPVREVRGPRDTRGPREDRGPRENRGPRDNRDDKNRTRPASKGVSMVDKDGFQTVNKKRV